MSKKKVVKKATSKKIDKKSGNKSIKSLRKLIKEIEKDLDVKVDGYVPEVKTTTFTSTTFDDIVSFPKYPVNKPGFHVVGKTSDVDLNEQILKSFVKDGYVSVDKFEKPVDDSVNFNEAINSVAGRNEIRKKLKDLKEIHAEYSCRIVDKDGLNLSNVNESTDATNRNKVNNANKLFEDLASKVGQITKEYWQAKHKLVMINKFMESFYAGGNFEKLEPLEKQLDLKESLAEIFNLVEGEDSEYKKSVLKKVRPDKYK